MGVHIHASECAFVQLYAVCAYKSHMCMPLICESATTTIATQQQSQIISVVCINATTNSNKKPKAKQIESTTKAVPKQKQEKQQKPKPSTVFQNVTKPLTQTILTLRGLHPQPTVAAAVAILAQTQQQQQQHNSLCSVKHTMWTVMMPGNNNTAIRW